MEGWGSLPGEPIPRRFWAAGFEVGWQCVGRRTLERGLMGGTRHDMPALFQIADPIRAYKYLPAPGKWEGRCWILKHQDFAIFCSVLF